MSRQDEDEDDELLGERLTVRLPRSLERRLRRLAKACQPRSNPSAVLREIIDLKRLEELERKHGVDPRED